MPVEILGFDKPPPAGEICRVVESDRIARQMAQKRAARHPHRELASAKSVSLEDLFDACRKARVKELTLIIKADVQGSVEAAGTSSQKLARRGPVQRDPLRRRGIGESDIMLASASNAIVVGFNVRPNAEARRRDARASTSAPTASSTS